MAAGGASFLAAVVVFSMLIMSSLGDPKPLCSDCGTLCSTNCTAEASTSCNASGNCYNPRADCQKQVFEGCTRDGFCCSSDGTCTCDCNTVAQERCSSVTDGSVRCDSCKRGMFDQCYPACVSNCNTKCKKKGCDA
ncbi:hypothetical protein ACQJBY_073662 [Aegilops geniculata]